MAGRGRGRGRGGGLSINIETFGLGRGDVLTPIKAQPPPLYPALQFKPVPLLNNDELEYRLALKQELRDLYRKSQFYVNPPKKVKDIERYSDKYQIGGDALPKLTPFWDRLPHELREKRKRKNATKTFKPNIKKARHSTENVEHLLDKLEKEAPTNEENEDAADANEEDDDDENKKKDKDEEGDEDEEGEYDDEDLEEETDYNMAYFDNGEGYGDDDDDDDEGPTY